MQPFDPAVAADRGNAWELLTTGGGGTFNPLLLSPGRAGTINVTITPAGAAGTTVSGFLYIDTFNFDTSTGDEVVRIPYSYTIVK
jgi:hypothetical protein